MNIYLNYCLILLMSVPGALIATTAHEFTRALVSTRLGDDLPANQGRLTLNPMKHLEPIGFMLLIFIGGFGWGKPVETSALYYKDRKKGILMTAILPSVVNLVLAALFMILYRTVGDANAYVAMLLMYCYYYNVALVVYNCVPVVPMDCVKVLSVVLPANQYYKFLQYEKTIQMVFLLLLFFGLNGIFSTIIQIVIGFMGMIFL